MEKYKVLLRINMFHEYSEDGKYREVQLQFSPEMERRIMNHRLLLRQPDVHVWEVVGNESLLPVPEIVINVWFQDPYWHWYTAGETWKQAFEIEVDPAAEKIMWEGEEMIWRPASDMKLGGQIKLKSGAWQEQALNVKLKSRPLYWEYILLARTPEREDWVLMLEEKEGRIRFGKMERIEWNGQRGWRCYSQEAVPLRQNYTYVLRLLEKKNRGTQILKKWVPFPLLGQFIGEKPEQEIRQIIYY